MKLYHATNANYRIGQPLLSLLAQVEQGFVSEEEAAEIVGRWEADETYLGNDGAMVSLTADLSEAEYIRAEWNGGQGVILEIDGAALQEDGILRRNAEGYPAVQREILSCYIVGEVA